MPRAHSAASNLKSPITFASPVLKTLTIMEKIGSGLSALLAAGLPALVLLGPIWLGQSSFLVFHDAQEQTYAWWQTLAIAWQQGYLPLWDSHIHGGHSFVGEIQSAVFYPLSWLWLVFFSSPEGMPRLAIEGFIGLHFCIASWSMFVLLRHWRLGVWACLFGALCFALFGPVAERASAQPNIFVGLTWLPLAVLFTSLHLERSRLAYAVLAGMIIGLQILSGHAQPAFHTGLLCGALCIFWHLANAPNRVAALTQIARSGVPMGAAALLIASPQLFLTLEYLADAYRWIGGNAPIGPGDSVPRKIFLHHYVVSPAQFFGVFDPWLIRADDANTTNLTTLGALLALWVGLARAPAEVGSLLHKYGRWLRVIAVFAILAMLGHWTPLADVLRKLPVSGQIRELGRYAILLQFSACVFAAVGLDRLCQSAFPITTLRRRLVIVLAMGFLLTVAFVANVISKPAVISAAMALLVLFVATMHSVPKRVLGPLAMVCTLVAAFMYRDFTVPQVRGHVMPEVAFAALPLLAGVESEFGLTRIIFEDSAGLPKNYANVRPLQSKAGHSATMYRPYFDFLSQDWSLNSEVNDLLNVRYVVSADALDLPLVAEDKVRGLRLYSRPSAYPRVFLASRFRDPDLLQRQPLGFKLLAYSEMGMRFQIELPQDDRVVVSELDYPGWCAQLDGVPVPIERAILGDLKTPLRSLLAAAGKHEVSFEYRPFARFFGGCGAS